MGVDFCLASDAAAVVSLAAAERAGFAGDALGVPKGAASAEGELSAADGDAAALVDGDDGPDAAAVASGVPPAAGCADEAVSAAEADAVVLGGAAGGGEEAVAAEAAAGGSADDLAG